MTFIYRFLNIAGIFFGVTLLSIAIPEYNSVDAASDLEVVLSYGWFSLVGGIFFYYKFYTRRKKEREERREVEQELEAEAKRKAELEKKKKLEAEAKRKAELEKKKKQEAEAKRKAELEKKKKLEVEAKRKAELEKKKKLEAEAKRKAELEKNSYYYEIEINNRKVIKGPFSKEHMINLLEKNEISLLTNVKFGLDKKTFKRLKSFPEFTTGFEDFL